MKNIFDRFPQALFGAVLSTVLGISAAALAPAAHAQAQRGLPDFTELYEKNAAAVVSIETRQKVRRGGGGLVVPPGADENDPFFDFFRRFGPRGGQGQGPGQRDRDIEIPGSGSGFIISADGFIVTNAHVVEDADEVRVLTSDKREFKAKVIGTDKRTDTALIKVEAKDLPKATIGDPNKLKVGEWVVAIGQPFGLESTMTAGILSAKQRDINSNDLVPFLQSDVAINPGNSGGPLFNMRGEVIGVNSMIFSRSGGYQGVAFSIPIDVAMSVAEQLRDTGKVRRGRIGVSIGPVDKDKAEAFGLTRVHGALVNEVVRGAPAEKAGIEAGDIIVKFDGKSIERSTDLPRVVTQIKPGTKATAQLWRKGTNKEVSVVVEEMKEDDGPKTDRRGGSRGKDKEPGDKANRLGLILSPLTEEEKKELKLKNGLKVEQNVSAARNLQEGDVILALVNKGAITDLRSVDQLNQLLAKTEVGTTVTFQIRRGDNTAFLSMRVGE